MRTHFNLEVNGIAEDTAFVKIVVDKNKAAYILFSADCVEQPDFILSGKELEEFAVNILKSLV